MTVTFHKFSTTGRQLFSEDHSTTPSVWGEVEEHLNIWLGEICNPTVDNGNIISGSGYGADAVYSNVDLVRAATTQSGGKGMKATVTVAGGGVSNVEITQKGNGFKSGDFLIIPDLAQLGGTGSGFQIPVLSGDASIGLVRGLDDRSSLTGYPVGWVVGVDRNASYNKGFFVRKTSNTTTTYATEIYNYDGLSTSNNGYGNYSQQYSHSVSTWYNSNGDSYDVNLYYCTEPNNRFFIYTDSVYRNMWGWCEVDQDDSTNYVNSDIASKWMQFRGGTNTFLMNAAINGNYTVAYVGYVRDQQPWYPYDSGVLFNGWTYYGRTWTLGKIPSRIYQHMGTNLGFDHIYQDGVDTYRSVNYCTYIRMN